MRCSTLSKSDDRKDRKAIGHLEQHYIGTMPRFGNALQGLLGDPTWQTLLAFRLGYSTHERLRSPRRGVNEVVKP